MILISVCFLCDGLQAVSLEEMYFSQKVGKVSILACVMFCLPSSELLFPEPALSLQPAWLLHGLGTVSPQTQPSCALVQASCLGQAVCPCTETFLCADNTRGLCSLAVCSAGFPSQGGSPIQMPARVIKVTCRGD